MSDEQDRYVKQEWEGSPFRIALDDEQVVYDAFAREAMRALIRLQPEVVDTKEQLASLAYDYADAMMRERKRRSPP
jgi:hypothetical protein